MFVGAVGEDASLHRQRRTVGVGKVAADGRAEHALVARMTVAVHAIGIDLLLEVMVLSELESRHAVRRKAVVAPDRAAFARFHVENRKGADTERARTARLRPDQDLSFRP